MRGGEDSSHRGEKGMEGSQVVSMEWGHGPINEKV